MTSFFSAANYMFKVSNRNIRTRCFRSTEISSQRSMFFISCISNFIALILQPETVKLNVTKNYILVDVVELLALV